MSDVSYVDFQSGQVVARVVHEDGEVADIEVGDGEVLEVTMEGDSHEETLRSQHPRPSRAYGC